jgi:hypothetical protein
VRNEHVRSIEVAEDQNTARDPRRLEFVEAVVSNGWRRCKVCVGSNDKELCFSLPCQGHSRKDGRTVYWREVRG